jgi:hypothetical protein
MGSNLRKGVVDAFSLKKLSFDFLLQLYYHNIYWSNPVHVSVWPDFTQQTFYWEDQGLKVS